MVAWSEDLPEEWKSKLRQIKGFPDELVIEPYDLEIEERAARIKLRGAAVTLTTVLSILLVLWLVKTVLGGHPRVSLYSLTHSGAIGESFLFGLCLGAVVSIWGVAMHRFQYLGHPIVRALDLIWMPWRRDGGFWSWDDWEDSDNSEALRLLDSARRSLIQYALQDEHFTNRNGFIEALFVQSWIREQKRELEGQESPPHQQ